MLAIETEFLELKSTTGFFASSLQEVNDFAVDPEKDLQKA